MAADPIHASAASPPPGRGAPAPQQSHLARSQIQECTYVGANLQIAQRPRIWENWTLLNARATGRNLSPLAQRRLPDHPEDLLSDHRSTSPDFIVRASVPHSPNDHSNVQGPARPQETRRPNGNALAQRASNSTHTLFHSCLGRNTSCVHALPGDVVSARLHHTCYVFILRAWLNCAVNAQQIPNGDELGVSPS